MTTNEKTGDAVKVLSVSRKIGADGRVMKVRWLDAYLVSCKCQRGHVEGSNAFLAEYQSFRAPGMGCFSCGYYFKITQIRGIENPNKKCDGRCTHAKGGDCECACGGANHGRH